MGFLRTFFLTLLLGSSSVNADIPVVTFPPEWNNIEIHSPYFTYDLRNKNSWTVGKIKFNPRSFILVPSTKKLSKANTAPTFSIKWPKGFFSKGTIWVISESGLDLHEAKFDISKAKSDSNVKELKVVKGKSGPNELFEYNFAVNNSKWSPSTEKVKVCLEHDTPLSFAFYCSGFHTPGKQTNLGKLEVLINNESAPQLKYRSGIVVGEGFEFFVKSKNGFELRTNFILPSARFVDIVQDKKPKHWKLIGQSEFKPYNGEFIKHSEPFIVRRIGFDRTINVQAPYWEVTSPESEKNIVLANIGLEQIHYPFKFKKLPSRTSRYSPRWMPTRTYSRMTPIDLRPKDKAGPKIKASQNKISGEIKITSSKEKGSNKAVGKDVPKKVVKAKKKKKFLEFQSVVFDAPMPGLWQPVQGPTIVDFRKVGQWGSIALEIPQKDGNSAFGRTSIYRGRPLEVSARLSAGTSLAGSTLLLGDIRHAYWFDDLFDSRNPWVAQRLGYRLQHFNSLTNLKVGNESFTASVTAADLKYRLTPGAWNFDETWGANLSAQTVKVGRFDATQFGGGVFWARSMPKVFDKFFNRLPYMNHPKWVDAEFNAFFLSSRGSAQLNYNLNFYGKVLWTDTFFGEASFGLKRYQIDQSNQRFSLTLGYATVGIGLQI